MNPSKSHTATLAYDLKGYLLSCLIVTITIAVHFEPSHAYAEAASNNLLMSNANQPNGANNDNKPVRVEDTWSFFILILSATTIAAATIATIYTEYTRRSRQLKAEEQTVQIILNELEENKESLVSNFHK